MEIWYSLVDQFMPFEWAKWIFMKNALLAVLIITPIFGILSTMIVNNQMAFFSDSIGHSALTGIGIGVIIGIKNPLWAMIIFSVIFAIFLVAFKNANTASTDTIIGVFSSTAIALGIVMLSKGGKFGKYSNYLIGDLLNITKADILYLAILLVIVLIFWFFLFNKLLVTSINESLARSRGVNVQFLETLFTVLIAIIVAISIQWVGTLIINSLLILPGASARNISRNVRQYHGISVLIAVVSGLAGLFASYYLGTATGATIVLIAAVFYVITFVLKSQIRGKL